MTAQRSAASRTAALAAGLSLVAAAAAGCAPLGGLGDGPWNERNPKPTPTPSVYPTDPIDTSDRIAYVREERGGHVDDPPLLWTSNADATDPRPVGDARGERPGVSPDGTRIVLDATVGLRAPTHLFTVAIDGSDLVQLTTGDGYAADATYTPDGTSIVYSSSPEAVGDPGFTSSIRIMDVDGSNQRPLLEQEPGMRDFGATFSPDGATLLFIRQTVGRDGSTVMLADADGGGLRTLEGVERVSSASFSPDGRTVVVAIGSSQSVGGGRGFGIWTIPVAGGTASLVRAATDEWKLGQPSYSRDGARILVSCQRDLATRRDAICMMDADGEDFRIVHDEGEQELDPVWF